MRYKAMDDVIDLVKNKVRVKCYGPPKIKLTTEISNPAVPIDDWNKVVMRINNITADGEHAVVLVPDDVGAYDKQEVDERTSYTIVSNEEILDLFRKG